jgi:hypothetical protein
VITDSAGNSDTPRAASLAVWFGIGVAVALSVMFIQSLAVGGWSGLLAVGEESELRTAITSEFDSLVTVEGGGHDGQITYIIARDPFGAEFTELVPQAPLRWRRLVFPAISGLFGMLSGEALLASMVAWSAVSIGLAAAALRSILASFAVSVWAMIGLLANPGVWLGLQLMTPDPMALGLGLVGIALALERRTAAAVITLTIAAIAKEPYLVMAAATGAWAFFEGRKRQGLVLFALPTVGLIAWSSAMSRVVKGSLFESNNTSLPGVGIFEASAVWPLFPARETALTALALTLVAAAIGVAVWCRASFTRWHIVSWATLALLTSEWVWRLGSSSLRAFAPLGVFVAIGIGQRLSAGPVQLSSETTLHGSAANST